VEIKKIMLCTWSSVTKILHYSQNSFILSFIKNVFFIENHNFFHEKTVINFIKKCILYVIKKMNTSLLYIRFKETSTQFEGKLYHN
jgi:hypothetical protein